MDSSIRAALSGILFIAASHSSAGVLTQDGVVFTSTFAGKVLTLEIDAARRSGAWAQATAIDALALKTIGSFSGVKMSSSTGAAWSLGAGELKAKGCAGTGASNGAEHRLLCVSGAGVALTDNMLFTFSFDGAPLLAAPHLKVHFVNANGTRTGSLLSMDFPLQLASAPAAGTGTAPIPVAPELVPAPVLTETGKDGAASADTSALPGKAVGGVSASQVPEPQSIAMAGAGLALIGLVRRKRRPAA